MKHSTPDKAKFKKLQRRLGLSLKEAVGTLELLWRATIVNAMDGAIGRLDNETIAIECDFDGDPDLLIKTLVDCGWLDRCDTHRLVVHDWREHAPTFVKGNLERYNKQFAIATCLVDCSEQPTDDESEAAIATCPEDASTKSNLTIPNQTKPNQAKPNQVILCSEPPEAVAEPVVGSGLIFPVKHKTQKTWELPQSKLDEWRETFHGLDVLGELRKARQWCADNPVKRKTAKGMIRFLSNWISKANDRGSQGSKASVSEHQERLRQIADERERREAAEASRRDAEVFKPDQRSRTGGVVSLADVTSEVITIRDDRTDDQAMHDLRQQLEAIE